MLDVMRGWLDKYLSDEEAVLFTILLLLVFIVILTMGNPPQLRETAMAPDTRRLVQLKAGKPQKTHEALDVLLSKKRASDRKAWLERSGDQAELL